MKIQRTIPPSAAPIYLKDLLYGIYGILSKDSINQFESELRTYFEVKHVFLLSSGKAALTLILLALKSLSNKNKVLIPAYTCYSVPSSILKANLKIHISDVNPVTLDFNFDLLKKNIDNNTLCVVPSHLFGIPSNVSELKSFCKDKRVFIVEDAAQAMGVSWNGNKLGTLGDVGFFSLGRGKNITCSSGGIIITNSDEIANSINKYYSRLNKEPGYECIKTILMVIFMILFVYPVLYWFPAGLPFLKLSKTKFYRNFAINKINGFKAGLLWNWRKRLKQYNKFRVENGKYYFNQLSLIGKTPKFDNNLPFLRFPVMLRDSELKKKICSISKQKGLGISPMYPTAINGIKEIHKLVQNFNCPAAEKIAETLVTFPTHSLINERDRKKLSAILEMIKSIC